MGKSLILKDGLNSENTRGKLGKLFKSPVFSTMYFIGIFQVHKLTGVQACIISVTSRNVYFILHQMDEMARNGQKSKWKRESELEKF